MTRSKTWGLVLAVVAGILIYLNQQTDFGLHGVLKESITGAILVLGAFGVSAAAGPQIGVDIEELVGVGHTLATAILAAAVAVSGLVTTFHIGGDAKSIIIGLIGLVTTIFGPAAPSTTRVRRRAPVTTQEA